VIDVSVGKRCESKYASYLIKTFGATWDGTTFHRFFSVIEQARAYVPDSEIVGFFLCALERPPVMTGLIFCDDRHDFPPGLPAHTPPIVRRFYREGYLIVEACTGGLFVVAHWYHENGALRPFYELH